MRRAARWPNRLLVTLLLLALPTFLVATNVRWAFSVPLLYEYGFSRNRVSEATGISQEDLRQVARDFTAYFNSSDEFLDIQVHVYGVERPLLNERELIHMRDVKGLVGGVGWAQVISLAFLVLYVAAGFVRFRGRFATPLARRLRTAGLVTAGGVVVVGALLAVAFPALFYLFHVVSFSNTLWQLDPRTDYLVWLFPSQFFFEATLLVALATLVEAALLAAVAWVGLRFLRPGEAISLQQPQGSEQSLVQPQ